MLLRTLLTAATFSLCCLPRLAAGVDLADLVAQVEPSVVRVMTQTGQGSGVIVDAKGLVITNYHVIEDAGSSKVILHNKTEAKVAGTLAVDQGRDLALLQLEKPWPELKPLALAGAAPRKGEKVAAFGHPIGLAFSMTEGIVSAVRTGTEVKQLMNDGVYDALGYVGDCTWIQTTAAISGGNSGGPLVSMDGKVVALNTWSRLDGQSLNFAVAAEHVQRLLQGAGDKVTKLPNPRKRPRTISLGTIHLEFPSGRVFSPAIFAVSADHVRNLSTPGASKFIFTHPNGTHYAAAQHRSGVLHGTTFALYEDGTAMTYANYDDGQRHGLLKTWNEAGDPAFFCQYIKGRKHGFCCFYDRGVLQAVIEFERDQFKTIQMTKGGADGGAVFNSRDEAEKSTVGRDLLAKFAAAEAKIKANEVSFKKQITTAEESLRRARAAALAPEKRRNIQERANQRDAANAAVMDALLRRARGF